MSTIKQQIRGANLTRIPGDHLPRSILTLVEPNSPSVVVTSLDRHQEYHSSPKATLLVATTVVATTRRAPHNQRMEPRGLANSICDTLRSSGHDALLVGGCVRDILLKRAPADYDVATDATPDQVMALFPDSVAVGAQFGVIVVYRDGRKVEVATFRADVGYSDGRHPDAVVFARSPKEDVQRRDFTINGLLMRHDTGEVLDYVEGQADLGAGLIRAIGEPDRRLREDKLRLLRAVRFAARFGFKIEPETFDAIRRHAHEINQVSAERLRDELTKLLTEGAARRGFELLDETGLLGEVLPEIARRLRFSNDDTEQIVALVANHMRFKDVEQMRASTLKRFIRLPRFEEHLELHRLDCMSSHKRLESYGFVTRVLAETPAEEIRPPRLLTGDDLLEMGHKPGPLFREILHAVEDAQLEGHLRTKEEAREFVRRDLDSTGQFARPKRAKVKQNR